VETAAGENKKFSRPMEASENKPDVDVEAIECYDAVLRINPCHHQVWSFKGNALLKLERLQEAKDAFAHFVRFAPPESQYISQAKELMQSIEDTIKMEKRTAGGSDRRVVKKRKKGDIHP
jgi:cytochrome c-type biogenesis protein CcmH/NrfG